MEIAIIMEKIIFTDLDGTLLDHNTYSYKEAEKSLEMINKNNIPLVICSSKTRSEIEFWREKIENTHPFISENGGGIFIPKNYFDSNFKYDKSDKKYFIIVLGKSYKKIIKSFKKLKKKFNIIGFHEMSANEIAKDANLSIQQAKRTKRRDFDEPFKIIDGEEEEILIEISKLNLRCIKGGRYYHLTGPNDKGRAVMLLLDLYRNKFDKIITIGIGDSENDFPMLDRLDHSYIVQQKNGEYISNKYITADGVGPVGWQKVVEMELKKNSL